MEEGLGKTLVCLAIESCDSRFKICFALMSFDSFSFLISMSRCVMYVLQMFSCDSKSVTLGSAVVTFEPLCLPERVGKKFFELDFCFLQLLQVKLLGSAK